MGYITQGTGGGYALSGLGTFNTVGQAVFNIGWSYVFVALSSDQLTGALVNISPATGAPASIKTASVNIAPSIPFTTSWNNGNCIHVTTVDSIPYMYIRYSPLSSVSAQDGRTVYRGQWNNTTCIFENFIPFATMSADLGSGRYNSMARINNTTIRIITDTTNIFEFDVRTGAIIKDVTNAGGSWSPSSYTFANTFVPISSPTTILGASGSGRNWYYQTGITGGSSFDPEVANTYADGFGSLGGTNTAYMVHPSTHFNLSYFLQNNGYIYGYTNTGVYIQDPTVTTVSATNIGIFSATITGTVKTLSNNVLIEYGTTTSLGSTVTVGSVPINSTFTYDLPGLSPNTTYYYRVSHDTGTGYRFVGSTLSFKTKTGLVTLTTQPITNITTGTATGNATIVSYDE
jgi:hypothetical protein